jgi:hypothetical protein
VQFDIRHIHLDSAIAAENNGWLTFRNATLEGKRGELFLADSLHKIQLKKIKIDYSEQTISIDSFELIPLIAKAQLHDSRRYETNLMKITLPKVRMIGVDIHHLMVSNKLHVDQVLLDRLSLDVFRDKNPPIPYDLYIEFPQVALKKAKLNIKIDTIHLTDGHIRYEELSDLTQKAGVVFFSEINGTFLNITNDSVSWQQNSLANLKVSAKLMGKGKFESDFTFDLSSNSGDHWIKGSLSQFEMTELNIALIPLRALSIRSGFIDELEFDISLNNNLANGKVKFLYSDFKIDKLDEQDLKGEAIDDTFKSFLANTFLMQSSNPTGKGDPRIGTIHYYRAPNKGIVNFWLKSIVDGVKSTVAKSSDKD